MEDGPSDCREGSHRCDATDREEINSDEFLTLKPTVLFGYADMLAIGCRVLLGLRMGYNYHTFHVPELSSHDTVKCQRATTPEPNERYFEPLQILDCKYEQFSLVIVNTEIPPDKCHYVIYKLIKLCRASHVKQIIALSCIRTELERPYLYDHNYFENSYNGRKVTMYPTLPGDSRIRDSMLCTLIQLLKIECIPLSILTAVGHKAHYGQSLDCHFSYQTIEDLQKKLSEITGLEFDHQFSMSLIFEEYKRGHTAMSLYT